MTEAQAVEAIYQRWNTTWPTLEPDVSFVFENEVAPSEDEWVRVSVRHTFAEQATVGVSGRKWRREGFVMVQIFAAANNGTARLSELVGHAREVLQGQTLGNGGDVVHLYEATPEEVPTDGRWAMRVVRVRFRYEDTD